jgi:hypothetical protein
VAALVGPQGNLALVETRWYEPGQQVPQEDLVVSSPTETVTTLQRTDLDSGLRQEGLRRWDVTSPAIRAFEGVDRYDYDPSWVLHGVYVPGDPERTVPFEHLRDHGSTRELAVPGEILLRIADRDYRLNAFDDGGTLLLVFGDPTNGDETYASGRFLFIDLAEFRAEGAVTLDFNRAFVPPCGFSDQFNCPLPPASNRVAVPVRAGERVPRFAADFAH